MAIRIVQKLGLSIGEVGCPFNPVKKVTTCRCANQQALTFSWEATSLFLYKMIFDCLGFMNID